MAVEGWKVNPDTATPCQTARDSWQCPNMLPVEETLCGERYACSICGRREYLNYDEMR